MGLTFHYNGIFHPAASLQEMISEVEDIARIYKWKYDICNTKFPANSFEEKNHNGKVYGIDITPPGCENFSLCFLSNGRMSSRMHMQFYGNSDDEDGKRYLYMLSVKTQFAGPQTHMMLIQLLKYIGNKYLLELNVTDEGDYWQTQDEQVLNAAFKKYNIMLDSFSTALETFPVNTGETFDDYFKRVIDYTNKKMKE